MTTPTLVRERAPSIRASVLATDYGVNANVSGADGRVLGLGSVEAGADATVRSVIDQGDTWIFTFSFGGTRAAKLSVSEAELERADWTVEVPAEAEERLGRAGYEPPGR